MFWRPNPLYTIKNKREVCQTRVGSRQLARITTYHDIRIIKRAAMVYERVFFITAVLCFSCLCWSIASPRPSERKTRVSDPRKVENVRSDGGSLETEPFVLARFKRFEKEWPNGMSKSGYEAKAGKSLKGKSHFFRVCSFDISVQASLLCVFLLRSVFGFLSTFKW